MKTEQIKEESLSQFLKTAKRTASLFHQTLKKESKNSILIAENEITLTGAVSDGLRAFRDIRRLPVLEDGTPRLYRFTERFLAENTEPI